MKIMIFAGDLGWAIGNSANENSLPWENIPEDMGHFRATTKKYPFVVMGYTTWKAIFKILGKPLPGRINIVLSTTLTEAPYPGVIVCRSVEEVLTYIGEQDCSIIGGAQTYESFMPYTDEIIMTRIHSRYNADCYFKKELLKGLFYKDAAQMKILRKQTKKMPLVTVSVYKRHGSHH